MSRPEPVFTCATCDVTIAGHPTFHLGLAFCCAGCAADGPCMCSYDTEEPPARAPRRRRSAAAEELAPAAVEVGVTEDERVMVGAAH